MASRILQQIAQHLGQIVGIDARHEPGGHIDGPVEPLPLRCPLDDPDDAIHDRLIERVPLMGIDVAGVELRDLLVGSAEVRKRHGLLTNDSLVAAQALALGGALASADGDFARVEGLKLYRPTDLD